MMLEMWIWFGIAVVLLLVELATVDLVAIWLALSALILGVIAGIATERHIVWQIGIFVLISGVLLVATRPLIKKFMQRKKNTDTNLELVIGHKALVVEEINNDMSVGAVRINGLVWTARSVDGSIIEKDTLVWVKEIQGNKAFVEKE